MRRLKFRAWDIDKKEMKRVIAVFPSLVEDMKPIVKVEGTNKQGFATFPHASNQVADFVLMQYTGLRDRNGKEIYEGDIIKVIKDEINGECEYYEVVWNNEWGLFECVDAKGNPCDYELNFPWPNKREVIGNIYENPELLPLLEPDEDSDENKEV